MNSLKHVLFFIFTALVCGMLYFPNTALTKIAPPLLIDNFNDGKNGQDPPGIAEDVSITGANRIKYSYVNKGTHNNSPFCIMFDYYNVNEKRAWGKINLAQTTDFSKYTSLTFWVRGEKGGEKFKIYLRSDTDDPAGTPAKENRPDINNFLLNNITTEWQQAVVPIREISKGINPKLINHIQFQTESELGTCIFYINP